MPEARLKPSEEINKILALYPGIDKSTVSAFLGKRDEVASAISRLTTLEAVHGLGTSDDFRSESGPQTSIVKLGGIGRTHLYDPQRALIRTHRSSGIGFGEASENTVAIATKYQLDREVSRQQASAEWGSLGGLYLKDTLTPGFFAVRGIYRGDSREVDGIQKGFVRFQEFGWIVPPQGDAYDELIEAYLEEMQKQRSDVDFHNSRQYSKVMAWHDLNNLLNPSLENQRVDFVEIPAFDDDEAIDWSAETEFAQVIVRSSEPRVQNGLPHIDIEMQPTDRDPLPKSPVQIRGIALRTGF